MDEKPAETSDPLPTQEVEPNYWAVHAGEALTSDEAYELTSEYPTKLIALAGPVASGKTTLLASIFHVFQRAGFKDLIKGVI
jgi:polynucleotide 5'-kinase involved in rRNA processing